MSKIRKKFITTGIDESYYSIINNIENIFAHQKINDDSDPSSLHIKSGVLASSKGKYLKRFNSEYGTLPSVLQTTGKPLQSYNDPFLEYNILVYEESKIANSTVGLPVIELTEDFGSGETSVGHYITTNKDLISLGTISKSDYYFDTKFELKNTNIYDSPNIFNNNIKHQDLPETVYRTVKSNVDNIIFNQKRFEEKHEPFYEDFTNFVIPNNSEEFFYKTIDEEISENYDLGKQRQIKIVLDFSNEDTADLTLLNTKLTFNLPQPDLENYNSDNLISTKYINFINPGLGETPLNQGGGTGSSYSSHSLPTAYWNFKKNRWNYLDGNLLDIPVGEENNLDLQDFPVLQNDEIKYSYLGAKNTTGHSTTISSNFIYDESNVLQSQEIYDKILKNNTLSVYNKPIVTTPGFRPDGSMNSGSVGNTFNKTPIASVTNTYGFPYKNNWQPNDDHTLDMSKYISNDFLLEKMTIKGSFTSKGELPCKKGNFSSGYRQENEALQNYSSFNEVYDYKQDFEDYISNNLTFFILNERKGFNHVSQKIAAEPLQNYFYSKSLLLSQPLDYYNTKGKKLENYLGSFSSYEEYQKTLNVYSQIIPNSFIYSSDEFNNLVLKSNYKITSNGIDIINNNSNNLFHFFENVSENSANETIDSIYVKNNIAWPTEYNLEVNNDALNKKYNIKRESFNGNYLNNFDYSRGRELVAYSNYLIVGKKESVTLDENTLINVDNKKILNFNNIDKVNININQKQNLNISSFVKNIHETDYIDESIYKIKSNFKEEVVLQEEEISSMRLSLGNADNSDYVPDEELISSPVSKLFQFEEEAKEAAEDGASLYRILGLIGGAHLNHYNDNQTFYNNIIGDTRQKYLNNIYSFDIKTEQNETKRCNYLIYFTYQNPFITTSSGNTLKMDDTEGLNYFENANDVLSRTGTIRISDFITYRDSDPSDTKDLEIMETIGGYFTEIVYNLRFLDPFDKLGITNQFYKAGLTSTVDNKLLYDYKCLIGNKALEKDYSLSQSSSEIWKTGKAFFKLTNYLKFIYTGIFNAPLIDGGSGAQIIYSNQKGQYGNLINFGSDIVFDTIDNNFVNISSKYVNVNFFESNYDPYVSNSREIVDLQTLNTNQIQEIFPEFSIGEFFTPIIGFNNVKRGLYESKTNESYYNVNNVLEGKSKGMPNNLGIASERIVNKKIGSNFNLIENETKIESGKIIKSKGSLNFIENSSYLLKPEDNLVFGVSSNSNGEVMPSVVTLHDKLEITLIGRDYISNKKHKTNECKSIRKIVTGDKEVERIGKSIYQTEGLYFDSIWNKTSENDNLQSFNNKRVIGKNSSRDFGTYTGLLTFDKVFSENKETIYQSDTVNPTLGNVYLNCLNKTSLYSIDSRDRYEYNKSLRLLSQKKLSLNANEDLTEIIDIDRNKIKALPSYKLIFSDSIKTQNILNYPNRYTKIVTDWHKTFHMQRFKDFFQDVNNKKIVDYSYDNLIKNLEDNKSNFFVYFDINSYSAGLNYENDISFEKKYIESGDKDLVHSELGDSSTVPFETFGRYYNTIKTHLLPFSKHYVVQNALNIENNSDSKKDKFIDNKKLIQKNILEATNFEFEFYSIQYMLHDIEPEYCDITSDVKYKLFGLNNKEYSSGWCLVIQTNETILNSLISNLSLKDRDLFLNNLKQLSVSDVGDGDFKVVYYKNNLFFNISEKNIDDTINIDKTVTKKFKVIRKVYDDNTKDDELFFVSPLHFWETSELNFEEDDITNVVTREQTFLENLSPGESVIGYGRRSNFTNYSNNTSTPLHTWYATLDDGTNIGNVSNSDIYQPFINDNTYITPNIHPGFDIDRVINITGDIDFDNLNNRKPIGGEILSGAKVTQYLPFDASEFTIEGSIGPSPCLITKTIAISFPKHKTLNNQNSLNAYSNIDSGAHNLKNNFYLDVTKKYFISNEFFENAISVTNKKENYALLEVDESNLNYNINEKIYFSNSKKIIDGQEFDTNSNFIYKTKKLYLEEENLSSQESYNIIDLKGIYNNFTIFKKNKILEQELLFDFENNNSFKVYEESVLKNIDAYSESKEYKLPYFEIDLSQNLSPNVDAHISSASIKQIPYTHYSLDYNFNPPSSVDQDLNVEIQDTIVGQGNWDVNTSSGSPIFFLDENPEGYINKSFQEEKIKDFFYGFSRKGKHRYPITNLDGFKYGVECGSKKSFKYYYKNNSFGQFCDKIMGSTNYSTAKLDKNGNTLFSNTVEKKFVNEYFEFISTEEYETTIRSNEYVYNKDRYCRSFYPYVENSNDDMSQLNSENPYFNESFTF